MLSSLQNAVSRRQDARGAWIAATVMFGGAILMMAGQASSPGAKG